MVRFIISVSCARCFFCCEYWIVFSFKFERGGLAVSRQERVIALQAEQFVDDRVFQLPEIAVIEIISAVRHEKDRVADKYLVVYDIAHAAF